MATATATPVTAVSAAREAPPEVPLPRLVQTARFLVRPIPFFEHWRRRLGETFAARLLGPGDVVFVSDPRSVKQLFSADRVNTIAPGRNVILRPLLGQRSLLLQEGEEHMRRRKLMLPPFHGERMRAYESLIAEVTAQEVARWPLDTAFALHPGMQAITLEVIMRAVFGVTDPARRDALREGLVAVLAESASPAAVGLIVPAVLDSAPILVPLAASGLVLLMIGAMVTHLRRNERSVMGVNVVLATMAVFVAWGRFGPHPF